MSIRLDSFIVEHGYVSSRQKAQAAIKDGYVFLNGKLSFKPATLVKETDDVCVTQLDNYVSRGAYKLEKAIDIFGLNLKEKTVLDIGASTGGFTQVALRHGAQKVYAVDVGSGELDLSLREDKRVVNIENQDFRLLSKDICPDVDMIIGDVSFISLRHIFPHIQDLFGTQIEMMMLFKPQFECGAKIAKKFKGVVLDKKIHLDLLQQFSIFLKGLGFHVSAVTFSPIQGKSGNIEYLLHIKDDACEKVSFEDVVNEAFQYFRKARQ